ncbi:hypothetical protein HBI24_176070 [Parastagonospora nodorum]|nr:hypothetical protein HBH49_244320 [Parastagonospora nodorum]KAH5247735.1 hypothetical protein HBI70_219860 [Parastagonospora nodorum]KAH5340631.1 hypothetical protein HBI33_241400 [Parastagonospora nodorum]KAH5398023.1 hypothetical protein HBI47_208370 [Parastagonospora nodorum]KAH5496199.1 hypothetical protein HBI29_178220 [Parastagonospora nodorum]
MTSPPRPSLPFPNVGRGVVAQIHATRPPACSTNMGQRLTNNIHHPLQLYPRPPRHPSLRNHRRSTSNPRHHAPSTPPSSSPLPQHHHRRPCIRYPRLAPEQADRPTIPRA